MKYDEFLNQIARQIKFNLPENLFFITLKNSKTSHYFYIGTEKQLDMFSNDIPINENELLKLRISDHDAMCARSYSYADLLMRYFPKSGYHVIGCNDFEIESKDENFLAKEIAKYFVKYL